MIVAVFNPPQFLIIGNNHLLAPRKGLGYSMGKIKDDIFHRRGYIYEGWYRSRFVISR
jgi:hypothetical protein